MSMQNQDWHISRSHEACHKCQKKFEEDEPVYSAVKDEENKVNLLRDDFCCGCWPGIDTNFYISYWKTLKSINVNKKKAPVVDNDVLLNLFQRLNESDSLRNQAYAYLLSLILMRKRVLVFDNLEISEGGLETMVLSFKYKKYGEGLLRVDDPQLSEEEMTKLNDDLSKLVSFGSVEEAPVADESAVGDDMPLEEPKPEASEAPADEVLAADSEAISQ